MKKILLLLAISFSGVFAYSQSTTPEVISSAGDYYSNSNMSLSWTIGEPVIETQSTGTVILTQGFHQGLDSIVSIDEQIEQPVVVIFPNPTADYVNIDIKGGVENNYRIQLFDELGQILVSESYEDAKQINLSTYAKATYFLKVLDVENKTFNSYKILRK